MTISTKLFRILISIFREDFQSYLSYNKLCLLAAMFFDRSSLLFDIFAEDHLGNHLLTCAGLVRAYVVNIQWILHECSGFIEFF